MDNPGLPDALWSQLDGGLWHATNRDGLNGIVTGKEIKVAMGNRYVGSFCRHHGGISLFDLGPNSEDVEGQFHSWRGWFGHHQQARVAVWLEINRAHVHEGLLDAKVAREAWKASMHRTFIPGIEACHRGPIPISAVAGVLLIDQHKRNLLRRLDRIHDRTLREIDAFEETLPAHEDSPLVKALLAGRQRIRN